MKRTVVVKDIIAVATSVEPLPPPPVTVTLTMPLKVAESLYDQLGEMSGNTYNLYEALGDILGKVPE